MSDTLNVIVFRIADVTRQIHQACRQANDLDRRQAEAVEARIHLDLRIGAAFTRLMTMSLQTRIPEVSEQVISYGMSNQADPRRYQAEQFYRSMPIPDPRLRRRPIQSCPIFHPRDILVHLRSDPSSQRRRRRRRGSGRRQTGGVQMEEESSVRYGRCDCSVRAVRDGPDGDGDEGGDEADYEMVCTASFCSRVRGYS